MLALSARALAMFDALSSFSECIECGIHCAMNLMHVPSENLLISNLFLPPMSSAISSCFFAVLNICRASEHFRNLIECSCSAVSPPCHVAFHRSASNPYAFCIAIMFFHFTFDRDRRSRCSFFLLRFPSIAIGQPVLLPSRVCLLCLHQCFLWSPPAVSHMLLCILRLQYLSTKCSPCILKKRIMLIANAFID